MIAPLLAAAVLTQSPLTGTRVGNYLEFDVAVNGKPARFILDTGAGINVLHPDAAKRLGIEGGRPIRANGVGGSVDARLVELDSFKLAGFELAKSPAAVIPLPEILETDGLIGYTVLQRYVAIIDFEKGMLTLAEPRGFRPPEGFTKLEMRVQGNIAELPLKVEGHEGWVKVDTGASDSLTFFKPFVEGHKIREKVEDIRPSAGGRGVGGSAESDSATADGVEFAGYKLPPLRVELSKMETGAFADAEAIGNLGSEVLRRFTVILDYTGKAAWVKPNSQFNAPLRRNRAGLAVDKQSGKHRVVMVLPGLPGDVAGLKPGDEITHLNGKPIESFRAMDLWLALREPAGVKVELGVRRGNDPKTVTLTLSDRS